MDNQPIRLNKFLATRLGLSRREADDAISDGKVLLDGQIATLGAHIDKNSKVCYNGKIVTFAVNFLYLAMNKPAGYVCSRRAQGAAPTLYGLLPSKYHQLKTVGRLDKDSSGLILLTNDGNFAFQMTHPKFHKQKIYEVSLDRPLEPLHQQMISDFGVMLPDGPSKFLIEKTSQNSNYKVYLSEGRNRQIRRTFAALGYVVKDLHRTHFGPYSLSGLETGSFVELPPPKS